MEEILSWLSKNVLLEMVWCTNTNIHSKEINHQAAYTMDQD